MNKSVVIYSVILSVALLAIFKYGKQLEDENLAYRNSISVLMDSIVHYQVNDSLKASQVRELQLKLSDYKRYRKEDAELIKKLKADKPQSITKVETRTEYKVVSQLKDSIIYKDVYKDTLKMINYQSKWTDLIGYINKDTIQVKITNREELMFVESIQRKKFLGIKLPIWLFGYKHKTIDAISKNPNTTITGIEHVSFIK